MTEKSKEKAIAIVSGGLDSVTLAYLLAGEGYDLHLLSFDYGQRHKKELTFARMCAEKLGARHDIIDLGGITHLLKGSALTDAIDVPEGHYAADNMRATVVPNRNAVMLSIAYAVAVAEKARLVAIGVHSGDHPIYPDCRVEFINSFDWMEHFALQGYASPYLTIYAPFVHLGKHDIIATGHLLNVDYAATWSCYKGGEIHCGRCGTCVERVLAFKQAGVEDPTNYEDKAFALSL